MEESIRAIVRPTERVRVVLEARDPSVDDHRASRALVVVTRIVESGSIPAGLEQGCLLVLKAISRYGSIAYVLYDAIPIDESFEIGMSQQPSATIELRAGSVGAPRTDLTITIKSSHPASMNGSSPTPPSLIFTATNLEILRDLLARCKRLKDASSSYPAAGLGMNSFGGTPLAEGQTWPWLQPYLHFHHPSSSADIPLAYSLPADLRLLHPSPTTASPLTTKSLTPSSALYSHLSPSHAASTSDSMGDIDAIRDAWVRSQVVSLSTPTNSDHTEKSTLNIHVGTFNVNGKLPAEGTNLDSWLGIGHTSRDRLVLPPVPAVSPLEVPLLSSGGDQESGTEGSLEFKLRGVSSTLETSPLDIIVLAFQELDLSTAALIYATEKSREEAWTQVVLRSLNNHSWKEQPAYTKISSKQLVGMLLLVFVRTPLVPCFTSMHTSGVGAGIMGMMGNKGGVAIRLGYVPPEILTAVSKSDDASKPSPSQPAEPADVPLPPSTSTSSFPSSISLASTSTRSSSATVTPATSKRPTIFTFINSHLAAFDEMYDRRNADFTDLSRRLSFNVSVRVPDFKAGAEATWPPVDPTAALTTNIYESDVLIWMGDLNYRVDLPDTQVRSLLQTIHQPGKNARLGAESMALLQRYDQLKKAQRDRKAFVGFTEAEITHIPTYRFSPGMATDSMGYDSKRKPAWTDRVLHMSSLTADVRQISYAGHPDVTQSDHRPVSASFQVKLPHVDTTTYEKKIKDLWRQVAGFEDAEEAPRLELESSVIELGKISYEKELLSSFNIKNIGRVPCAWRLVPFQENSSPSPEWMSVDTPCGLLLPQETAKLTIHVLVSQKLATELNLGPRRLDHTLIIRLALGQDLFLAVGGEYEPTVFGNSAETLSRLSGSIRAMKGVAELKDADKARGNAKVVMKLIGWLMDKGSSEEGLFMSSGETALVSQIQEALDLDIDIPSAPDNHVAALATASTLLKLLQSLSPPLIPSSLHSGLVTVADRDEAYQQLTLFPPESVNIWVSLNAFLHFYIRQSTSMAEDQEAAVNVLADELAGVFAPVLMADEDGITTPISPADKQRFMKFFITD